LATKAVGAPIPELESQVDAGTDLYLIAVPISTYRLISDVASKRNLTFAQALKQALDNWMGSETGTSRLLMEQKEGNHHDV